MLAEHFEEEEDNDDGSDGEGLAKINQSKITFGNKSLAESIYNRKSSKKSELSDDEDRKSDGRDSVSKLTLEADDE